MKSFFEMQKKQFEIELDKDQQESIVDEKKVVMVLAGPGSGKTTVLLSKMLYLISVKKILPNNILGLTFNKAANSEMISRFENIYGVRGYKTPYFKTHHSFCLDIIKIYEKKKGKRFKRIEGDGEDGISKKRILINIYKELGCGYLDEETYSKLVNLIGYVKNTGEILKNIGIKDFEKIYEKYEAYKKKNWLIDFDDMPYYADLILAKDKSIRESIQSKYRYILLDETQDLSKIQVSVIKRIFNQVETNLFIVADDDQSIYGFRGAMPSCLKEFESLVDEVSFHQLKNNYRSDGNIVSISSEFISKNRNRYSKMHREIKEKKMVPVIEGFETNSEMGKYLIDRIKKIEEESKEDSIAILFRSNESAVLIANILSKANISFRTMKDNNIFFQRKFIKNFLNIFRYSLNQSDELFTTFCFQINQYVKRKHVEKAMAVYSKESILVRMSKLKGLNKFERRHYREVDEKFKCLKELSPREGIRYIESEFSYGEREDIDYCSYNILDNIAKGIDDVEAFLVRLEEIKKCLINNNGNVILSTMHASKGCEYDHVFIVDLNNYKIPGEDALKDERLLEEERRLFYVALTRAKQTIHLSFTRTIYDRKECASVFLHEIFSIMIKNDGVLFKKGDFLNHRRFKNGEILKRYYSSKNQKNIAKVSFEDKKRKIDLRHCLESCLISWNFSNINASKKYKEK